MKQAIGFIGLGNMGLGMSLNLSKKGFKVLAYDIDQSHLELGVKNGVQPAKSISQIAQNTETVILCLPHPDISENVIFGRESLNSSDNIGTIIDTSTLTPEYSQAIFDKLKKKDVNFLCSPMIGGKEAAVHGQIHFLIEGERRIFEENRDLFEAMGARTDFMGAPPRATITKLAYNLCRFGNVALASEVTRFVREFENDTNDIFKILAEGSIDNFGQVWNEDIKEMILTGKNYEPSNIPEKDLSLIIEIADKMNLSTKLFDEVRVVYKSLHKKNFSKEV